MNDQVPFGKYKGRPVEEMLSDGAYMAWLEAQPWFRDRFGHLKTAKDSDATSRTPVHNKLQTMFLDTAYQFAFFKAAAPAEKKEIEERARGTIKRSAAEMEKKIEDWKKSESDYQNKIDALTDKNSSVAVHYRQILDNAARQCAETAKLLSELTNAPRPIWHMGSQFEQGGADVRIVCQYAFSIENRYGQGVCRDYTEHILMIEIKPTVADEYPAVLRQMNRNKSEFLFVGEYHGEGATQEQFVRIFANSGKKVVFKRDVDALIQ